MGELWFWQYEIVYWDSDAKERVTNISGLVTGIDIVDAVKNLYSYYGEEIMDIKCLKPITDCVFEFSKDLDDFDYEITKKEATK